MLESLPVQPRHSIRFGVAKPTLFNCPHNGRAEAIAHTEVLVEIEITPAWSRIGSVPLRCEIALVELEKGFTVDQSEIQCSPGSHDFTYLEPASYGLKRFIVIFCRWPRLA